jgi:hypothetical protein
MMTPTDDAHGGVFGRLYASDDDAGCAAARGGVGPLYVRGRRR